MKKNKKREKNSFEKMCDKLDEEYTSEENQITFVRKYVAKKIGNDYDLLLKIQAEARDDDYVQYIAIKISIIAMFFTAIGVILQLILDMDTIWDSILRLLYLALIAGALIWLGLSNKFDSVRKWRMYVLSVLEERIAILEKMTENGKLDYKKAYDKVINYLASRGCPPCSYDNTERNKKCIYCMEHNLDTQEKKIDCWRKQFETE